MINLKPIHSKIQKRMFEKMSVLSNGISVPNASIGPDTLTRDKLLTRTTFTRMTSGLVNAVSLAGGSLKSDFSLRQTFDDVYGPRSYKQPFDTVQQSNLEHAMSEFAPSSFIKDDVTVNRNLRPMPGIKSIDVSFKGGAKALRTATINWTCWSFDELNQLMPHFLAHGKTVMLDWGWVYDNKSLENLPNLLTTDETGNYVITGDAYKNYSKEVINGKGDFDMMVGLISNFEFTTRDDGAFDCQTIITSVGVSILEATMPNKTVLDPSVTYNLSVNDNTKKLADKLTKAIESEIDINNPSVDKNPILETNTNVTLKVFIEEIDSYLNTQVLLPKYSGNFIQADAHAVDGALNTGRYFSFRWVDNKFLTRYDKGTLKDGWVRWGWFEDNVLSKFLSLTTKNKIITEFRSIEGTRSVMIKNNPLLETLNINRYILPGQLRPLSTKSYGESGQLKGDFDYLHKLSKVVNDNDKFELFTTDLKYGGKLIIEKRAYNAEKMLNKGDIKGDDAAYELDAQQGTDAYNEEMKNYGEVRNDDDIVIESTGYLRNMLINTKLIKQAFGIDSSKGFNVESVNIVEALESLFILINQDISFWNFELTVDSENTQRVKIIDNQITHFDFNKTVVEQTTGFETRVPDFDKNGNVVNPGVFFFPVWTNDSIVKRQNITAKIPNAMALTTMYGANMDQLKEFDNPGNAFGDKSGVAAGGLFNQFASQELGGLGLAFRTTPNIGTSEGKASEPITVNGSKDNIIKFLNTTEVQEKIRTAYEDKLEEVNEALKTSEEVTEFNKRYPNYDDSIPPPIPNNMSPTILAEILKFENNEWGTGELENLFNSKYLDNGEMKPAFKSSIHYLTTQHGIMKQSKQPLMIPFDLELDIDGIGGIYPGNSFHSSYLPAKYQSKTVFQMFDVNHRVDSSGWTTSITGKMRATLDNIFDKWKTIPELKADQFLTMLGKAEKQDKIRTEETKEKIETIKDKAITVVKMANPIGAVVTLGGKAYNYAKSFVSSDEDK